MDEFPPPLRVLQLILAGFCLFLVLFGLIIFILPQEFFSVPAVVLDNTSSGLPPLTVSRTFAFQNGTETVTIDVSGSVWAASKKTHRSLLLFGDQKTAGVRYYRAMIDDPSQDRIYRDLIDRFRTIRAVRNLTDDEYLELISAYVQSIPYKDGGNMPPKYPAELLVENMGDCDDKSILIAGLLAREGYTVALLKFGPEQHMAMGIGSDAFPYKATGYTYLEGMTPAFVGSPTAHLQIPLNSDPLVLPISTGTKVYRSGNETHFISETAAAARQREKELTARLDAFPLSGKDGEEYRAVLRERDRSAAIRSYILSHPYDRPGTYAYLQREMKNETGLSPSAEPAGTGG
ncbi:MULTISPECIES: hypothetical protein [unclassified Methanoregula]|uniref:hypothetical protein n=1 Tax=unclassified Methanoregula TaxID=2649730 RepID=UPI0009C4625F|nr:MULTISPECIES: hypothetical protein [unclassified Methanoregula]OPX63753.1 MAG: hypothetical protein A4E33_01521 [Methanoregula sp. PtaB.Bin085]OPY35106.1 MAG: hypothetical protein A4E34_01007 [Methanoregula sp. PtaU1.Bin006]